MEFVLEILDTIIGRRRFYRVLPSLIDIESMYIGEPDSF